MKFICLFCYQLSLTASAQGAKLDTARIETITGMSGQFNEKEDVQQIWQRELNRH